MTEFGKMKAIFLKLQQSAVAVCRCLQRKEESRPLWVGGGVQVSEGLVVQMQREMDRRLSQLSLCRFQSKFFIFVRLLQKPANILVMGEGPERGRVKIGESDQRPISELRRQRLTFAGRRSDELAAPLHKER